MDGIAECARRAGIPATSVAWARFAGAGMMDTATNRSLADAIGLRGMDPPEAFRVLAAVVARRFTRATVAAVDWSIFEPIYSAASGRRRLLATLVESAPVGDSDRDARLVALLDGGDAAELSRALLDQLREEVALALWRDIDEIHPDADVRALGLDSLTAVTIKRKLEARIGRTVPAVALLREPTPRAIAAALTRHLVAAGTGDVDLEAAAALPPELAKPRPVAGRHRGASLLTGSTGFVGSFLLRELMLETDDPVFCLVRAGDTAAALDRIRRTMERFELWAPGYEDRIVPVIGDLAAPGLGIQAAERDLLSRSIARVYHSGAWLNPTYSYRELADTNVGGTLEVLRLVDAAGRIPLHMVSSIAVFPWDSRADGQLCHEEPVESPEGLPAGYCETKWVSERMVWNAARAGYAVTIYRPSFVTGCSVSGVSNAEDLLCRLIKGSIQLGAFPDFRGSANLAPVDFVSRALARLSRARDCDGGIFHLCNPAATPWRDIGAWIREIGYDVELLPYADWRARLLGVARSGEENALYYVLPLFKEDERTFTGTRLFDSSRAARRCSELGVDCPRVGRELIERYFRHFWRSGFLAPPAGH